MRSPLGTMSRPASLDGFARRGSILDTLRSRVAGDPPEEDHLISYFSLKRTVESFEVRVAVRRTSRRTDGLNASALQEAAERRVERTISVHDEKPLSVKEAAECIR